MKRYRVTFKRLIFSDFKPTDDPITNEHLREKSIEMLRTKLHYIADLPNDEFKKILTEYEYDDI